MTDATLIKVFLRRDVFESYRGYVDDAILSREVKMVLSAVKKYYESFDDSEIALDSLRAYFTQVLHPGMAKKESEVYRMVFDAVREVPDELAREVILSYHQKNTKSLIVDSLERRFDNDELQDILNRHIRTCSELVSRQDPDIVVNDVDAIFAVDPRQNGIRWRLQFLNDCVGPITKGSFVLVGAYTDVGKTSFAISESVNAATQIDDDVLILNNEEFNERVLQKVWKCVTGMSESEIRADKKRAKDAYIAAVGRIDKIKVVDIRNKTFDGIKALFRLHNPGYVVVDQVDKIENMSYKSFTNHDRLKKLYGEFRTLCNQYCPVLAISQVDVSAVYISKETNEAEYMQWVHHRQLDGSKIGKAGEMDVCIMIGRDNSNTVRYLNVTKNKFGQPARTQVYFDGDLNRYTDTGF